MKIAVKDISNGYHHQIVVGKLWFYKWESELEEADACLGKI
jgi:hypothetical protein